MEQKIEELEKRIKSLEESMLQILKLTNQSTELFNELVISYKNNMDEIQIFFNGKGDSIKTNGLKGNSVKQMLYNAGLGTKKKW